MEYIERNEQNRISKNDKLKNILACERKIVEKNKAKISIEKILIIGNTIIKKISKKYETHSRKVVFYHIFHKIFLSSIFI
jgi:hypothetical protein